MRVLAVTLALVLTPALAVPQSLGDAARRQAHNRSARPPATRVFTDADLPTKDAASAEAAADATVSEEPAAAPAATAAPTGLLAAEGAVRAQLDREAEARKRHEASWRMRAGAAYANLRAAQREHDAVCGPGVTILPGG